MSTRTDTAIIGAGVSGLYTAWRLVTSGTDPSSIAVYEAGERLGGRLWSVHMKAESALPAELGGMFFNDRQPLVYGLCARVFGLDMEAVTPQPDFAWLRARRFRVEQFADPEILPYRLAADEQGMSYGQLLLLAARRIAPELDKHWPFDPGGTREATLAYLRGARFDGRPLTDWGFWNLLARVISNEAWAALRDIVSSHTLFANWNGYDALVSLVLEQSGDWHRLTRGYQHLPERLATELESAGVTIHRRHALRRVDNADSRLILHLDKAGETVQMNTERLVLALPRHALAGVVARSPDLQHGKLGESLNAVAGIPACKIFLTFDTPWWRDVPDGPGKIRRGTYGVSHTDLPLRQCYYLGMDQATGRGLMLASYADGQAVSFWKALAGDSGRDPALHTRLGARGRAEIRRQLAQMHDVEVPEPADAIFVNWSVPPFGGGWHNWQPGWRSWEVMATMRRPDPARALHVCGEAFSAAQGWVEGALESAEIMLEEQFGLAPPDWLDEPEVLASYRA